MSKAESRRARILVVSHSHPAISRGGAEIAAFEVYSAFRNTENYEAWFLGCQRGESARLGACITQPYSEREFIYSTGEFDWFKFANRDPLFPKEFENLLKAIQPDIIHFHHFINVGIEAFFHVRKMLPNALIILTVHEYLAICHHYGQMVTPDRQVLCYGETAAKCNECFVDIETSDFFLRKLYIQSFLKFIDYFISPSHFLAERLIQWGVPKSHLRIIENIIPNSLISSTFPAAQDEHSTLRVGFFGQISKLKGINVIFDTAKYLESQNIIDIVFNIYGDYRGQPQQFQEEFLKRLDGAGRNIQFHGSYEPRQVDSLMQQVDVTIVPSIWWENSPVVIQEAFRNRRPVICSDIGGMSEKVRHGEDGWHFAAGSSIGLTMLLKRLRSSPALVAEVSRKMARPPSIVTITDAHEKLYSQKLKEI